MTLPKGGYGGINYKTVIKLRLIDCFYVYEALNTIYTIFDKQF